MAQNTFTNYSERSDLHRSQRLFQLALLAIVGQVILLASAWLLPLVSEYTIVGDNISELVLGQYGFVQTFAFLISGVGIIGLAYAIRRLTVGAWGPLTGALLIGVYGVGALLVALFPTDRIDTSADLLTQSTTGMIHSLVALVSFVCVVAGMVVLAWTFSRAAHWRAITPWAALLATGSVSLLLGQIVTPSSPWVGLLQRMLVTLIAGWVILVAFRVRALATAAEATGERSERQ